MRNSPDKEFDKILIKYYKRKIKDNKKHIKKYCNVKIKKYFLIVLLFPLYLLSLIIEKYDNYLYSNSYFTEEKAKNILDKYLCKLCDFEEYDDEIKQCNVYYYCIQWRRFRSLRCNRKESAFISRCNRELEEYLIYNYSIPNYTKVITGLNEYYRDTYVLFYKEIGDTND